MDEQPLSLGEGGTLHSLLQTHRTDSNMPAFLPLPRMRVPVSWYLDHALEWKGSVPQGGHFSLVTSLCLVARIPEDTRKSAT